MTTDVAPAVPAAESPRELQARLFSRAHLPMATGAVALITLGAFENRAVGTALPTMVIEFDAISSFGVVNAAPIATFVIALVVTGLWTDRAGPVPALRLGIAAFVGAQLLVGTATSMPMVIAGRLLSGTAEGFLNVGLMVLIARALPPTLRPRMFSLFAAAWVLPSVFGPPVTGLITERVGWRWVFIGAVVFAIPTWLLLRPAIRKVRDASTRSLRAADALEGEPAATPRAMIRWAIAAAAAVFALTVAGDMLTGHLTVAVPVIVIGAVVTAVSAVRLLPAGTFRADRGLPAIVGMRAITALAFAVTGSWLPLLLTVVHSFTPALAGVSLSITGVMWAAGSWLQGRDLGVPRVTVLRAGMIAMTTGLLGASLLALTDLPPYIGLLGWAMAATGMGLTWPVLSVLVLDGSDDTNQGRNNSAAQLAGSLGIAVGLAISGTAVALTAPEPGRAVFAGIIVGGATVAMLGVLVSGRVVAAVKPEPPGPVRRPDRGHRRVH